jgi:AcrR family transcriptional regulator
MRNRGEVKEGTKSVETRPRILAAALELFREKGFEATTMRDIASKADVATGAAYYYFPSKEAIVLEFYRQTTSDLTDEIERVLSGSADLQKRLLGIIQLKLRYFEPSRRLLSALAAHVDPVDPVSPFSERTREIREQDVAVFERVISGSRARVADDLKATLPDLLWLYQMGLILYWVHDRSKGQKKTALLLEKSLWVVVRLIKASSLPLMSPLRRRVIEMYEISSQ